MFVARTTDILATAPSLTTRSFAPQPDGRMRGIDGSVWLWRRVPSGSLRDAKNDTEKERLGRRLELALDGLARLAPQRALNRQMGKSQYRRVRICAFNVPVWFQAPRGTATESLLNGYFRNNLVIQRTVLFGVQLIPTTPVSSLRSLWESVVETFSSDGTPLSDFATDTDRIDGVLRRAELEVPDAADLAFADSWMNWSGARTARRATPYVSHLDHLHFLRTPNAVRELQRIGESTDCEQWPDAFRDSDEQVAVTFGAVESLDMGGQIVDTSDPRAPWAANLFDNGARAITVEGLVEPASVTRKELARMQRRHESDLTELAQAGKKNPFELEEHAGKLHDLEQAYATGSAPATMVNTSILVAFDGVIPDLSEVTPSGISIDPMMNAAEPAYHEMMLCSSVIANPHRLDIPITAVAYAGLPSLSRVGDQFGALAGFTELDRQPVWVSGAPQTIGDQLPIMQVAAATGSGKLLTLDTVLPTPTGHTTMGEVQVGDRLLWRGGLPCTVTSVSPVNPSPKLLRITLHDRQTIDACEQHQWVVLPPEPWGRVPGCWSQVARTLWLMHSAYPERVPVTSDLVAAFLKQVLPEATMTLWTLPAAVASVMALIGVRPDQGREVIAGLARRADWLADHGRLFASGETVVTTGEIAATQTAAVDAPVLTGRWRIRAAADAATGALAQLSMAALPRPLDAGVSGWVCASPEAAAQRVRQYRDAGLVVWQDGVRVLIDHDHPREFVIESLTPIPSRPGRCVTVDSPDSTYLCADRVPTHNTQLLLWLAHQWHLLGHPQFLLDPKKTSDHSAFVERFHGQVASLSDLEDSDGALDPLRFAGATSTGASLAAEMLQNVNPWGSQEGLRFEADLANAIRYGISRGAVATGQALAVAERDGVIQDAILAPVWKFADSYPMFAAAFGRGSSESTISLRDGMTLFMVGDSQFEVPTLSQVGQDLRLATGLVRVSANAIRMLIRAATTVLANRSGIIHVDEAWMVELLANGETEQLGRLARQMDVFPILYNQTPSTAVHSGVANYVARGFLGYIKSADEARAGLQLFGMEGNEEIFRRVTTPRGDAGREGGMNWNSLQHLYAPGNAREVIRGAVFYHSDLHNRVGAVEIVLPPAFLKLASSNPEDIRRRKLEAERAQVAAGNP